MNRVQESRGHLEVEIHKLLHEVSREQSRLLTMREDYKLNRQLGQNSLRRIPLLMNSATNSGRTSFNLFYCLSILSNFHTDA